MAEAVADIDLDLALPPRPGPLARIAIDLIAEDIVDREREKVAEEEVVIATAGVGATADIETDHRPEEGGTREIAATATVEVGVTVEIATAEAIQIVVIADLIADEIMTLIEKRVPVEVDSISSNLLESLRRSRHRMRMSRMMTSFRRFSMRPYPRPIKRRDLRITPRNLTKCLGKRVREAHLLRPVANRKEQERGASRHLKVL